MLLALLFNHETTYRWTFGQQFDVVWRLGQVMENYCTLGIGTLGAPPEPRSSIYMTYLIEKRSF